MTGNALPPFRADHVGSLLRPEELKTARAAYEEDGQNEGNQARISSLANRSARPF